MSICITSDGVNFDHIAKMVSAKLLHFKVTVLPFVINKYLEVSVSETMEILCYTLYFCSLVSGSIDAIITVICLMVI